ncbi:MAG: hypothetical protein L0H31_13100 [Nocardioidaceae bacterium]|nr:hypothetical protein [Nocardioidaceae bacterium]
MKGSIIIPAHDEASVIGRTLAPLAEFARCDSIDVVVAAHRCPAPPPEVARTVPGVVVLELPNASKVAALNAGEAVTDRFPRVYLDADVVAPAESVAAVLISLGRDEALAARPPFVYDTTGASSLVQAYYRARMRLPANSRALWGAGFYALSERGRGRFGRFPDLISDDYFVDTLFNESERRIVASAPVVVRVPRTASSLHRVLRRTYAGNAQLEHRVRATRAGSLTGSGNTRELARSSRTSFAALTDAGVYAAFALAGRWIPTRRRSAWQRDVSART